MVCIGASVRDIVDVLFCIPVTKKKIKLAYGEVSESIYKCTQAYTVYGSLCCHFKIAFRHNSTITRHSHQE
jgi:hypothetical protein